MLSMKNGKNGLKDFCSTKFTLKFEKIINIDKNRCFKIRFLV